VTGNFTISIFGAAGKALKKPIVVGRTGLSNYRILSTHLLR